MFRTKKYGSPENFTSPLEVIDVTFRRSEPHVMHVPPTGELYVLSTVMPDLLPTVETLVLVYYPGKSSND